MWFKEYVNKTLNLLKNTTWNGQPLPCTSYNNSISIHIKCLNKFLEINPAYNHLAANLKIKIDEYGNHKIILECPYVNNKSINPLRKQRYFEYYKKLEPIVWGVWDVEWDNMYLTYKILTKTYKTPNKIVETVLNFLDEAYELVKDGYEWSISDSVKKHIQIYIQYRLKVHELNKEIHEIEKKIHREDNIFNEYDIKYKECFIKIKNLKKDFEN